MKVLMTGSTGFVGQNLVPALLKQNYDVILLVRKKTREIEAFESEGITKIICMEKFEYSALKMALSGFPIDFVINLASYGVKPNCQDFGQLIDGNIGVLVNLLRLGSDFHIKRFIHMGSCFEYCADKGHKYLREEDPLLPFSLYGAAKLSASVLGQFIAQELAIPFMLLRSFGIYGIGEAHDRLLPYVIRKLSRNETVDLTPGHQIRDFLNVKDVVAGIEAAIRCPQPRGFASYNLCSGKPVTIRSLCEMAAEQMQKPKSLLKWGQRSYRSGEPLRLVGSNKAFCEVTGWSPQVNHKDGIQEMVRHYSHIGRQGA